MFEKENKPFIVAAGDPDDTTTMSLILQYGGHKVVTARDDREVLDILNRYSDREFTAIILTAQLPKLEGVKTARVIRERELHKTVPTPIIFIAETGELNNVPDLPTLAQGIINRGSLTPETILPVADRFANLTKRI